MKLSIKYRNTNWNSFEHDYNGDNPENDLACLFEYCHQYKLELLKKAENETDDTVRAIMLNKVNHIECISERYKSLIHFLMTEANSL